MMMVEKGVIGEWSEGGANTTEKARTRTIGHIIHEQTPRGATVV